VETTKIPRILSVPATVLADESGQWDKGQLGTRMFLIAPFLIRRETMEPAQGSKMMKPIFIGRWTPKVLFSLQEQPYRHGELRRRLQGVSQRMLTRTLRSLESPGLIARSATPSKPSCRRIFIDPAGEDHHRSASRYVPVGPAIPHEGERWRAPSINLTRTYPGVARSRNSCSKDKIEKTRRTI
jgi:DNA-binding HxlR family transcriptional regulator